MKRTAPYLSWSLLLCGVLVAGGQFLASAQPPKDETPAKATCPVAVLDVSRIFKEHKVFLEKLNQMKIEVEVAEKALREERDKIVELKNEMAAPAPGEPLKAKLEAEVTQRSVAIQVKMQLQKDEFMQQEAAIYRRVYKAMETTVADYARTGGIALVIRFNYIEMNDKSDRKTILAAVNRAIVFEDGVDITDEIIKRLNSPVEGGDL